MRFNKWCVHWLDVYKKRFIKSSTYESYSFSCSHINCKKKLEKLKLSDLQKIINKMVDEGLARSTIKHTVTIMVQACRRAHALGYCNSFDFSLLELPHDNPKKVCALTIEEQKILLYNSKNSFYGDLFLFLLYSGLRVGELIALRWSDVDIYNGIIKITRTDYRGREQDVKTASSQRDIPISSELKTLLKRHFVVGGQYVFTNTLGGKVNYRSLLDCWHTFTAAAGLPLCGVHVLRHTYATNALRAGVNIKVLSELLGHKSITVTLNIYTDVAADDKHHAACQISEFLEREQKNERNFAEKRYDKIFAE